MVLAVAVVAVLAWQWLGKSSPANVVDRAGQAIKAGDWKTVYRLVDWSEDQKRMLDEGRFVSLANVYGKVYALQEYKVGSPSVDGETAQVPVTVTARVSSLFSTNTKTETANVRCKRVAGEWRIAPDLHNGLIGIGSAGIGGL